jgi:Mn2+/Fe2+ NRAMP family transporter
MLIGFAISVSGLNPIQALVYAAVINAVTAVPIMAGVMIACSHRKVMGDLVLTRKWKIIGWAATAAMALAALALLATMIL